MNNDDLDLSAAFDRQAAAAPTSRPDFGAVLADRQSRMRRRTTVAAAGIVALGISGMAAFAVGGDQSRPLTDASAQSDVSVPGGSERFDELWFCEGAVDRFVSSPTTTTIAPPTTILLSEEEAGIPVADSVPLVAPLEDSGYFLHCEPVGSGPPDDAFDKRYPTTTILVDAQVPLTTVSGGASADPDPDAVGRYVVQAGDYAIRIADEFGVPLDELIAFNGWNSGNDFPFPGNVILIPPGSVPAPAGNGNTVAIPSTSLFPPPTTVAPAPAPAPAPAITSP